MNEKPKREVVEVAGYTDEDLIRVLRALPPNHIIIYNDGLMAKTVNVARTVHALLARAKSAEEQLTLLVETVNHLLFYGIQMGEQSICTTVPNSTSEMVH